MLFFGNIVKNSDNYKELTDLALRIIPSLKKISDFTVLDDMYESNSKDYAYYNSLNIYNKTGYFNKELYRFGVVFIYEDGTLSNVYPTLGGLLTATKESAQPSSIEETQESSVTDESEKPSLFLTGPLYTKNDALLIRNYIKIDEEGWIKSDDKYELTGQYVNARGVCQFDYTEKYTDSDLFYINFTVPQEVSKYLKEELKIRGLFFVRQKCIPTILAQCYLLPMDEVLNAPVLEKQEENEKKYYTECFVSQYTQEVVTDEVTIRHGGRLLSGSYLNRLRQYAG